LSEQRPGGWILTDAFNLTIEQQLHLRQLSIEMEHASLSELIVLTNELARQLLIQRNITAHLIKERMS
jgi:hypothetical protein